MIHWGNGSSYSLGCVKSVNDDRKLIFFNEQETRNQLIWKVASTCLAELVAASLTTGAACCFMATSAIPTVVISLITLIAITTLFHCTQVLIDYSLSCDLLRDGNLKSTSFLSLKLFALSILPDISALLFSKFNNEMQGVLIHEVGHAFIAWLLFKNADIVINIYPDGGGGSTAVNMGVLSRLGNLFGRERAFTLVVVAGPAFAILEATALLAFAHRIKDTYPEVRLRLVYMAITRVVTHVLYALSALLLTPFDSEAEGHDFFILWKEAGIHPVAAVVTMVAIPLFVQCALWKWVRDQDSVELD